MLAIGSAMILAVAHFYGGKFVARDSDAADAASAEVSVALENTTVHELVSAERASPPAQPGSRMDRLSRMLGVARPVESQPANGDPSAKVWADLRSGLYYCPGADAYGRTRKGKYMKQRDAELDHFKPAFYRPCQ